MADEVKVSELPDASVVDSAAIFVCDVSGVTSTCTREKLLTSGGAERIQVTGFMGSYWMCESNGGLYAQATNTQGIILYHTGFGAAALGITGVGNVTLQSHGVGTSATLDGDGSQVVLDGGGVTITPNTGGNVFITYDPVTSGDWSGDPTSIWEAIDRIAACLALLNGGPIP